MAVNVQVAFQGGGAKLVPLVAAAHAFRDAEEEGLVKVTRVAGTSAGAITACLFATGEDLHMVRKHLQEQGSTYLHSLIPRNISLANPATLAKLAAGYALMSEAEVGQAFEKLFSLWEKKYVHLGDLEMPVKITATELIEEKLKVFDNPNDTIVHVLRHSCGLPFVIKASRNLKSHPAYVDGGICENLPSDALMRDRFEGEVLAVSFLEKDVKHELGGIKEIMMSLMNAAINNSTRRACLALGIDKVHLIDTHIKTFDFEKALEEGCLRDHYDNVRRATLEWIRDMASEISTSETVVIKPVEEIQRERDFQAKLYKVFLAQHGDTNYRMRRITLIVQANCLLPETDKSRAVPDLVTQETEFSVTNETLYCLRQWVSSGGESEPIGTAKLKLMDERREPHKFFALPVLDESLGPKKEPERHFIVYFCPPLKVTDPPMTYTLRQSDRFPDSMVELRTKGTDHMSLITDRPVTAERVELVLFIPEDFPKISTKARVPDKDTRQPLVGRDMVPRELNRYPAPPEFRAVGWIGEGLTRDNYFGIDVSIADQAP